MVNRAEIVIELQQGMVFIKQGQRWALVRARSESDKLPTPDDVAAEMKRAGICGSKCIVVVPRLEWVLSAETVQIQKKSEIKAATQLAGELVAYQWDNPAYSTACFNKIDTQNAMIYAASIPEEKINRYSNWLSACGLTAKEYRLSCLTAYWPAAHNTVYILISGYPNGHMDVHWVNHHCLSSTYTLQTNDLSEFSKILALMTVKHLSKQPMVITDELPEEIELDSNHLVIRIVISGCFRFDYTYGINEWIRKMSQLGIYVEHQVDKVAGYDCAIDGDRVTWPAFSAEGVVKRVSSLRLAPPRSKKRTTISKTITAIALCLLVFCTVIGYDHLLSKKQKELMETWNELIIPYQDSYRQRDLNDALAKTVHELDKKLAAHTNLIRGLTILADTLPEDSRLESLSVVGTKVSFTLLTPSVITTLSALQNKPAVTGLTVSTALTIENIEGQELERVGVSFDLASSTEVGPY